VESLPDDVRVIVFNGIMESCVLSQEKTSALTRFGLGRVYFIYLLAERRTSLQKGCLFGPSRDCIMLPLKKTM
jgi:hypothetical protein